MKDIIYSSGKNYKWNFFNSRMHFSAKSVTKGDNTDVRYKIYAEISSHRLIHSIMQSLSSLRVVFTFKSRSKLDCIFY